MNAKRFLVKTGKILIYVFGFLLIVIIIIFLYINTNSGKRLIKNKLQAYLEGKLKTRVEIASIDFSLPKWIELKGIYLEDQKKDTFLFGERVSVDLDMLKLIKGNTYIRKAEFKNIYANIYRGEKDSVFNYQFIADAFASNTTDEPAAPDTAALKITLQKLILNDVRLKFNDQFGGTSMTAAVRSLDASLDQFQPDRMQFALDKVFVNGLVFKMDITKSSPVTADTVATAATALLLNSNIFDLRDINIAFSDQVSGMNYANNITHFAVNKLAFDLAGEKLNVDKVQLDSSAISFVSPKVDSSVVADTTTTASNWRVALNELQLKNNHIRFDNQELKPAPGLDFGHLDLSALTIAAKEIVYNPDSIMASVQQFAFADKSGFRIDTTHAVIQYSNKGIEISNLLIKTPQSVIQNNIQVKYDDIKTMMSRPQNTELNIGLNNTVIAVNDLYLLAPFIKKSMPEEKFRNNLIRVSTTVNGTLARVNIPLLQLSGFSGSNINAKAILYNVTDSNNLAYDITVFNSSLLKQDIAKFLPANNDALAKLPPVINFGTHLQGNLKSNNASIDVASKGFSLSAKGDIKNIDNPDKLQYNISISKSSVQKSFIEALVPPGTIPPNIQLPDLIALTGTARGDMNNIETNSTLAGSYGVVSLNGYIRNFKNPETASYDLIFKTQDFAVGRLIKQDTLIGNLTLSGAAKGNGFNYKTMNAVIKGNIESVGLKQYDYKNILLNASLQEGNIKTDGSIDDPNLQLKYTADAKVQGDYPSINATLQLDTVQLKQLNLYADTLNASLTASLRAANLDPANIDVYLVIDSSKLTAGTKRFALDSIIAVSKTTNGINNSSFNSQLADLSASGRFSFDQIGPSLLQYIDRYYNITDTVMRNIPPQQIAFDGVIKKSDLIKNLVPGLEYDSIHFAGNYASALADSALQLKATLPLFVYQTNRVSNGNIDIATHNDQLNGSIVFDTLVFGSNKFYKTAVNANVYGDSISIAALTKDEKDKDRFALGADIVQKDKTYSFSMKDSLLLNYQQWNVAAGNRITYSPDGILVNNFVLSSDSTKIAATSRDSALNSPIDISIDHFKIKDITAMANSDTLLADGVIDAKVSLSEFDKKLPAFTGDIQVSQLQFMQQPVGDIRFTAQKQDENTIGANMALTGNGNNVNVKGAYYLNNDNKQFDGNINIADLRMSTVQAFSGGSLAKSSGSIKGNIALDGKFADPHWNGDVLFDSTRFSLTQFGTSYSINGQKINLNYPVISLDNFTILDSANNKVNIDGYIASSSPTEYDLNLDMNAKNFTLVNVSHAIANQVYGFAAIDADIVISGSSAEPSIEGNLRLTDKSDVTLVLPETNVNKDAAKDVVRFIDRDTFALPEKFSPEVEKKAAFAQFLNYNLNLEVSKQAAITIIIDPSTGDELKIQGDAELNVGVDPGNNIVLAGNYELSGGYYVLNYQFLRKQFNLLPGSIIQFAGDPTDAQINITAEYIANTSAKDLIGNEVGEVDPRVAATFKQEIPFRVLLMMKGSMRKPDISFDIQLPDENTAINSELRTTIDNKLTQLRGDVAGTNKQVFSLLLMNRFVGEQSTDFFKGSGDGGGGFSDVARSSVSKFLSSALDNIASDLFKGLDVDLNLDTYKDYSSGNEQQRTDLNIAVTKSFVDDRLSITVGRSFGVEGQDANAKAAKQQGTPFLPDVTLNYKLTQDGKYMLRAYKKTQFEVILDGYVIETGLAFIVTLSYDKFKELFAKKPKTISTKK